MDVGDLPNLGPTSAGWLRAAGLRTRADLEVAGPVGAFLAVKAAGFPATLNLLWALDAALRGIDWRDLTPADKDRLRRDLAAADR